ncbi:MAG: hypothetical protein HUU54_17560, partial [Ignavibacteriaceae bacterium]|nr:hypothetical protein [Ignavibacteriaceae bacterium]
MKKSILLILIIVSIRAEIRYVKAGSPNPVPPYISWATAADSIGKALAVCLPGDTVFVGNGTYKETVVIPYGVSLIGQGRDSCVWDLRTLTSRASELGYIHLRDSCILKGFKIISRDTVSYINISTDKNAQKSLITENEMLYGSTVARISNVIGNVFKNCPAAMSVDYDFVPNNTKNTPWLIKDNIFIDCKSGIYVTIQVSAGSPLEISNNYFYIQPNRLRDYDHCYSNFISFRYSILFSNNIMVAYPRNYSVLPQVGLNGGEIIRNNVFSSRNHPDPMYYYREQIAVNSRPEAKLINNHHENNPLAINISPQGMANGAQIKYNNYWNVKWKYDIDNPDSSTELRADPMFVKDTVDFHLQKYSPLIDRGDPEIQDKDGTRSDIGAYGGLLGEIYTYIDKAPRIPVGLQVSKSDSFIVLRWRKNTEADFDRYHIYGDSVSGFTADSGKYLTYTRDTVLAMPERLFRWSKAYFRVKAIDRQGNKSEGSMWAGIVLTGMNEWAKVAEKYRLNQNYPNPWGSGGREKTRISYEIKERSYVKLRVYNILGDEVALLVNGEQPAGYYEYEFGNPVIAEELKGIKLA